MLVSVPFNKAVTKAENNGETLLCKKKQQQKSDASEHFTFKNKVNPTIAVQLAKDRNKKETRDRALPNYRFGLFLYI